MKREAYSPQALDLSIEENSSAFVEHISHAYNKPIFDAIKFIVSKGNNDILIEDVIQEFFLAICENQKKAQKIQKNLSEPYLFRSAQNFCKDYIKKKRKEIRVTDFDGNNKVEPQFVEDDIFDKEMAFSKLLENVYENVKLLSKAQKEIFQLSFVEKLKDAKVAEIVGKSILTVQTYKKNIRLKMKSLTNILAY